KAGVSSASKPQDSNTRLIVSRQARSPAISSAPRSRNPRGTRALGREVLSSVIRLARNSRHVNRTPHWHGVGEEGRFSAEDAEDTQGTQKKIARRPAAPRAQRGERRA